MKFDEKARMVLVSKLRGLRCIKCKDPKNREENCMCDAAVKLRGLSKDAPPVLTVVKYEAMKHDGLSDAVIRDQYGWDANRMNKWKRENKLINKYTKGLAAAAKVEAPIDGLSVDKYKQLKSEGVTDTFIADKYGLPTSSFYRWRIENGLDVPGVPRVKSDPVPEAPRVRVGTTKIQEKLVEALHFEDTPEGIEIDPVEDLINKPKHYHKNGIDIIGFAEMQLPKEQLIGFCRINVLKYVTRYDDKNGFQDLEKAQFYLEKLIKLENVRDPEEAEIYLEKLIDLEREKVETK